jgi:hypothetical protein
MRAREYQVRPTIKIALRDSRLPRNLDAKGSVIVKSLKLIALASSAALWFSILAQGCGGTPSSSGFDAVGTNGKTGSGANGGNGNGSGGGGGGFGGGGGATDAGGGDLLDAACATATAAASKQPVYMLIVLDGSGSMGQENKWTAVVPALDKIFDDIQASNDPSFGIGLNVFSDKNDKTQGNGPYPGSNDVKIAFVDATQDSALHGRIDTSGPKSSTPTEAALQGGYSELESFTPSGMLQPNGKKVLVLMTDGVPTDSDTPTDSALVAGELSKAAPQGPIETFVVGVGDFPSNDPGNFDPTFLGALAVAGGTAPMGCNANENSDVTKVCYFEIDPSKATSAATLSQSFVDAINKIRGQVASCTFTLQKNGAQVDPTKVNVVYTSGGGMQTLIPQDPTNGWTYDDPNNPSTVTLHGSSCDEVKNDAKGSIAISIGCPTVGVH